MTDETAKFDPDPKNDPPFFTFDQLRSTGVLWAINRALFHPRGYALALAVNDDGVPEGWVILGPGDEPWRYGEAVPENELFVAFETLLEAATNLGRMPASDADVAAEQ